MSCVTKLGDVPSGVSAQYPCLPKDFEDGSIINFQPGYLDFFPPLFDGFAKVLYSTILADLGISSLQKILTNASMLQENIQNFNDSVEANHWKISTYNELKDPGITPLNITQSAIYAEYFCQVTRRKPIGPLIVAIFVADIVFIQPYVEY